MRKILILTKTNWSEPPRIRHQITRLLKEHGFDVHYVEKNNIKNVIPKYREEEGIKFYSHSELIHHQLRYHQLIQNMNNWVVKQYLKNILVNNNFDYILNFCYDYTFIKEIAGRIKTVTFINDDFEEQAKFGMRRQIRNQIAQTCSVSDHVITVSYPLYEKLRGYNKSITLLFPWSKNHYKAPKMGLERNTVLYFGFIGRIDWEVMIKLVTSTTYNFRFVGPVIRKSDNHMITELNNNNSNFEYIPYSNFNELEFDDVFCSILPYDPKIKSVQACTISNRAFNLLSVGLPLVYSDLKNLIEAPDSVIRTNRSLEDYLESFSYFKSNYREVQKDIQLFLSDHYENNRWEIIQKIFR